MKKIKILYIAGTSRCGSTILSNVLGSIEGFCNVGEIKYIWDRGIKENWLCSCGERFNDCQFWNKIIKKTIVNYKNFNPEYVLKLSERGINLRGSKNIRIRDILLKNEKELEKKINKMIEYKNYLSKLYSSVEKITKCSVIVDSSKEPIYAYILSNIPSFEVFIIHLIREPHAVIYSRAYRKKRQYISKNETQNMGTTVFNSILDWNLVNFMIKKLFNSNKNKYFKIYYKEFVNQPNNVVNKILRFLGEDSKKASNIFNENKIRLSTTHVFSGNPSRLSKEIIIYDDDEWKYKMDLKQKLLISLFTLYKY